MFNIAQKSLRMNFIVALLATLFLPVLSTDLRLLFFAPFLVILYYQKSYVTCLWGALFCGLVLDLTSSQMRIGFYAINYCLTTWLLYGQKCHFFSDSLVTLPLMTFLFSLISTLIGFMFMNAFVDRVLVSWEWVLTDLVAMPVLDATYAFIFFVLPLLFLKGWPRGGKDYFL